MLGQKTMNDQSERFPQNENDRHESSTANPRFCTEIQIVEIGIGEKVLVVSDLLITPGDTPSETKTQEAFIGNIYNWDGPGVIIIAGNLLDLFTPAEKHDTDYAQFISTCPLFVSLRSLCERAQVKIFAIPGLRDSRLAFDATLVDAINDFVPIEISLKIDLRIANIDGTDRVLITSGREFDPLSRALDPFSPAETPWAQHLMSEFWPRYKFSRKSDWLYGVERLRDPNSSARFILSRLTYRKLVKYLPWALLPLLLTYLIKIPLFLSLPIVSHFRDRAIGFGSALDFIGITMALDAILLMAVFLVIVKSSYSHFVTQESTFTRNYDLNLNARIGASHYLENNYTGVISGHFMVPELTKVGSGFFACTGSVSEIFIESSAIMGLPSVFRPKSQSTWLEIEAGASLHVRLLNYSTLHKPSTLIERIVLSEKKSQDVPFGQIASFPDGNEYREDRLVELAQIFHRRIASAAIFLVGTLNLASALTPPIRARLHIVEEFVPISVSRTADAIVAMGSIGLLFLAGSIRRGQRSAWILTLAIALIAVALNLLKGGDFEEALALATLIIYLIITRGSYRAPADKPSVTRAARTVIVGVPTIVLFSALTIYGFVSIFKPHFGLTFPGALYDVSERLVGLSSQPLPKYVNGFATPALELSGIGLAAIALFLAFRPVVDRSRGLTIRFGSKNDRERARAIISNYSSGTLDYFALRDDKRYFFAHRCVIAYANYGTVALVSPDPVGPATTRNQAWREFIAFANSKGWVVAVLGADEQWLDTYHETGMHSMYVGDEAIVPLAEFELSGKKHKGLRQAVGRIKKYGYTVEFHDPSFATDTLKNSIFSMMGMSRKGDAERGFSMTLGRIFDPNDKGLLLTVCKDSNQNVVGFCQWVPASGINGYSLDLMRRDIGAHPNGLTDFMIVSTIEYLVENGYKHLSLNFATMRAVLSGELDSVPQKVEKWLLKRMSGSMQIESLWRFNAKFDPIWRPRYVIYDNIEHAPAIAFAIARAEAFWELPVIGRLLTLGVNDKTYSNSDKPHRSSS